MNKIISWSIDALLKQDFQLPDDDYFKKALAIAGLSAADIENKILSVGQSSLKSIFSQVRMDSKSTATPPEKWLDWAPLNSSIVPVLSDIPKGGETILNELSSAIKKDDLAQSSSIRENESIAAAFLERYGTYLSVSPNKPYLTFFECIKNAAAIYACLELNNFEPRFLLVGGDLSGIQNYLFNMSESQSKGVAKILRARSFYLGLFTEICRHYILQSIKLPFYCTIIDAGGRFILMAPDNDTIKNTLEIVQEEIEDFCLNVFLGELALNLSYEISLVEGDFEASRLMEKFEQLNLSLENKKSTMFKRKLFDKEWKPEKFVMSQNYDDYDKGLCQASGRLPKMGSDQFSDEFEKNIQIGKALVKQDFLGFMIAEPDQIITSPHCVVEFPFKTVKYCVHFLDKAIKSQTAEFYLIESLKGELSEISIPRLFANYVPRFEFLKSEKDRYSPFENHPDFSITLEKSDLSDKPHKGNIMDFGTLAYAGLDEVEETGRTKQFIGTDLLGVIKADVDRMGRIFTDGIKPIFSLSSYSTLSRQLDIFFTGYLPRIQEKKFKWIYTVYAGGDDLFFIGEWQQAIGFAMELYQQFRNYTGWNEFISLSSAIYIMQPHHPIRMAAENAEGLLNNAKQNNRDSLAIFNIVVKQQEFNELMEMAEFLDKKRKQPDSESNINSAFLHRLVKYREMALLYQQDNNIQGLMYIPRLAYDLGRNIVEWDKKKDKINKGEDELNKLKPLMDFCCIEKMDHMQFPIYWSIFKNRKIQ